MTVKVCLFDRDGVLLHPEFPTQLKKIIIENGVHYILHGDYYFPDLEFPETFRQGVGHYGRMRKTYLEKHRPGLCERLILSGKLYEHLVEIDTCCADRMDCMVHQMADAEGINEEIPDKAEAKKIEAAKQKRV